MYNKVIIIGNLTRDIELKYIPSGAAVAKSAIATTHKWKSADGEQKEEVCFLDFDVFGKSAEILNQYVRKGSKVMLEGRLALNRWTAQDGSNRQAHSLRVEQFKFLDTRAEGEALKQNNPQSQYQNNNSQQYGGTNNNSSQYNNSNNYNTQQSQQKIPAEHKIPEIDIDDDEIPF